MYVLHGGRSVLRGVGELRADTASNMQWGHCCAKLQLQGKGKALIRRPLLNGFLSRFHSQRRRLLVWHPPDQIPALRPLLMQVSEAPDKLIRGVLSLSHEAHKEPPCFLNPSSERNLGADGSSFCPRLYV